MIYAYISSTHIEALTGAGEHSFSSKNTAMTAENRRSKESKGGWNTTGNTQSNYNRQASQVRIQSFTLEYNKTIVLD